MKTFAEQFREASHRQRLARVQREREEGEQARKSEAATREARLQRYAEDDERVRLEREAALEADRLERSRLAEEELKSVTRLRYLAAPGSNP